MSGTPTPPGPYEHWVESLVGFKAQNNLRFLNTLWDQNRVPQLRDEIWAVAQDEPNFRYYLNANWNIVIPPDVHLMLVDLENARTHSYVTDPVHQAFYALVLPPNLHRPTSDPSKIDYKLMQALSGAWYHATSDSYGM
jgi:hypothetical protein